MPCTQFHKMAPLVSRLTDLMACNGCTKRLHSGANVVLAMALGVRSVNGIPALNGSMVVQKNAKYR